MIFVRFRFENYDYAKGEIVAVRLLKRDKNGVLVEFIDLFDDSPFNAWSDLGSFEEVSPLEVLALAAAGELS